MTSQYAMKKGLANPTLANLLRVDSVSQKGVHVHPMGGGFAGVIPSDMFEEKYEYVSNDAIITMENQMAIGIFSLDEVMPMVGYSNGRLWNGFSCPTFPRSEIEFAMANGVFEGLVMYFDGDNLVVASEACGEPLGKDDETIIRQKASDGKFDFKHGKKEIDISVYQPELIDGHPCYAVGSDGWTWNSGGSTRQMLDRMRFEARDWADALEGGRPSLDAAIAAADVALQDDDADCMDAAVALRAEMADWAEVLEGERYGLDAILKATDEAIAEEREYRAQNQAAQP